MGTGKRKGSPVPGGAGSPYNAGEERERNVIGSRIARARRDSGMSLAAFSRHLEAYGVRLGSAGISKWETGMNIPNAYQLMALTMALGLEDEKNYFIGSYRPALNEEGRRKVAEYKADLVASGNYRPKDRERIRYIEMPVSLLPVSAGTGAFLDEGNFELLRFPENSVPPGAEFGVRVSGDSMEPVYRDGQIVWVQRCQSLNVGEVGIFIYDGEGYLKAYDEREPEEALAEDFTDSEGTVRPQPVLVSYNERYGPRAVSPYAPFQVVGRVL